MPKVFISYASEDLVLATELAVAIQGRGLDVWMAPDSIKPGEAYPDAIAFGIHESMAICVILSTAAIESADVRREVTLAAVEKKTIVPIRIGDAPLTGALAYYLQSLQWVVWHGNAEMAVAEFHDLLHTAGPLSTPQRMRIPPAGVAASTPHLAQHACIRIRGSGWGDATLKILLDGDTIGELKTRGGKPLDLDVTTGPHVLQASTGLTGLFAKSKPCAINAEAGRTHVMTLSVSINPLRTAFGMITFDGSKYITLQPEK